MKYLLSLEEIGLKGQLREMMGHVLENPPGPRDQQLIQLVPPTLSLQLGHEENEEKQGNEYFSNLELNKEKYKESEC